MKAYRFHIIVFIILGLLAIFLNKYRRETTFKRREISFAVTQPEKISEIIISGGDGKVNLHREKGDWVVNSRYEARGRAVEMMLQTLSRLRVSSPAPISVHEEVLNKLRTESVRVDLRIGRQSRTYFVYSPCPLSPTYMLIQGSSQAFVIDVMGFSGNVASLFVSDEAYWRTNILFNYHMDEIAEVLVRHKDAINGCFILRQLPGNDFSLYSYPGAERMEEINDSLAIRFLANFYFIPFERFANPDERILMDSLKNSEPDYYIKVTDRSGGFSEIFLHKIIKEDDTGSENTNFDIFRLHGMINERSEMVILTYHSVDLILRTSDYFYSLPKLGMVVITD